MDLHKKRMNLKQLACKVFLVDNLPDIINLIDDEQIYLVQQKSEKKLEEAEEKVLETVYDGDCDFVLFDHYKHCRDFDSACTQYREEMTYDTRP
tara:strand:- start:5351 stop:5632 length:282 start_codon:yes stop_codon:yes gene_type:complete